ncbi:MAG: hypothetical protein V4663_01085 [Bacteroidota bacterium]
MEKYLFKTVLFALLVFSFAGCKLDDVSDTKDHELQELSSLKIEIDKLSEQVNCDNAADWKFTAIGAKACGGPTGYVAYSNKIDEVLFLKKVALYTEKQKAFNVKWNIASDCSLPTLPKSIDCISGKPKFVY